MRPSNYVIEVKTADYPGYPDKDILIGRYWVTRELIDHIVSEKLLTEVLGEKVLAFLKVEL